MESPADTFNTSSDTLAWPLTGSTLTSQSTNLWPHEKSLPPTPSRSRGVSLSTSIRRGIPSEEYLPTSVHNRMSAISHESGTIRVHDRPASWNPRCESTELFDLNLEKAILGTSLARDHRLASRRGGAVHHEEDNGTAGVQDSGFESVFNALKLSSTESNRSSMNGSSSMFRNYTWNNNDDNGGYRNSVDRRSSVKEAPQVVALTETQRHRNVMTRIVNERNLNPTQFDTTPKHARYFVIKSYNVFPN